MTEKAIWQALMSIPFTYLMGVVLILGLSFLITITMSQNRGFRDKILHSKKLKSEMIKYLLGNLDAAYYLINKTIKDNEIIGIYNTETIILAMNAVNKLEKAQSHLSLLEDAEITEQVNSYIQEIRDLLSQTYHMENYIYDYKKKSEQLILSYDREFNRLNTQEGDFERAAELKQTFKQEMNKYKQMVRVLENSYTQQRTTTAQMLVELNKRNENLQELLENYKKKQIDAKRFYASKLVYA